MGSMLEIFEQKQITQPSFDMWTMHQSKLRRIFTVKSCDDHDMYILTLEDLERLKNEYKEYYDEIFQDSLMRLQKFNIV